MQTNTFSGLAVISQRNQESQREISVPEKPFLNLFYKYTCDDVDQSMQAMLKWKNYRFAEKCNYLLEKTHEENKNAFLVALTPPVDQESSQSPAIDYFLNKRKNQCISAVHVHATELKQDTLAALRALPNNEEQIHLLKETLQSAIGPNSDDIYATLLIHLKTHEYNGERIKEAHDKAWHDLHDVFDEVMPPFLKTPNLAIKILFPYLSGERLDSSHIDGHWLTGEIQISRQSTHYQIQISVHNPFGGGQIESNVANDLQASLVERIATFHPQEKPTFTFALIQSPYVSARQFDTVSCGVIAVEELIKRLEGHSLDGQYERGCSDLRSLQYDNRWKYTKNDLNHLKKGSSPAQEKAAPLSPPCLKEANQETKRALHFLDIDEAELERITDNDDRRNKIHYKRLARELIYSSKCRAYELDEVATLRALDLMEAHLMLTKTQGVQNQQPEENQRQLPGLKDLELRGIYQKGKRRNSVVRLGEKKAGVEPGFVASFIEDQVAYLEQCFPERQTRLDYFNNQCGGVSEALYYHHQQDLPKYLVKLDYTLISEGRVAPDAKNLKSSHFIKNAYKKHPLVGKAMVKAYRSYKTGSPLEKNRDAVLEVLANDLARASGMNVQEQTLLPGTYENGELKLLLKGKWLTNASNLSPLQGGGKQSPYHNYRVKATALRQPAGICYIANHAIADLASHFATLLVQGDYDGIGEEGGNKLEINQQLYGIDFGHAYREENQIIQHLLPNWHLPIKQLAHYKNFSIFHDSKRSELAKGMLIYAKLAGRAINSEALQHYEVAFSKRLDGIESGAIETLIDGYINHFQNLAKKEPHHKAHYLAIVEAVKGTKKRVLATIDELLAKVGDTIHLPPQLLNCLDHLEKISLGKEGTSLRSPDGTVALQHIRVVDEKELISWSVVEESDRYRFSAKFPNSKKAEKVAGYLRSFLSNQQTYHIEKGIIAFSVMKHEFKTFAAEIAEDVIKQRFHQDDYTHYQELVQEQAIFDFTCSWEQEVDAYSLTFALGEGDKSYVLTLEKKDQRINTTEEAARLTRLFPKGIFIEDAFVIDLSPQDLNELLERLSQLKNTLPKKTIVQLKAPYQPKKRRDMGDEELQEEVPQETEAMEGIELDLMHDISTTGVVAAIKNGDIQGLQAHLLTHSVDEPIDGMGNTLLHYAISENQPALVRYLLETAKANPLKK